MFAPIIMNISESDIRSAEKVLFISFRTNLKKLLRAEYCDVFGEVCYEPLSKNIMMSLKDHTIFNGDVVKHSHNLNPTTCGILLANTVFTMFQMLCSLQAEYHVQSHITKLAGIVNDLGRGSSAVERIVYVMNTIYDLSSNHEFFDIVQDSVTEIETYLDRTFGCEIETSD
jgi:hypothetical protein